MIRTIDIKINVLRNGAVFSELKAISAPRIKADEKAKIKTSFSGEFLRNLEVDLLADELQPVLIIDGVESPLGIFSVAEPEDSSDEQRASVRIQAYDRCWRVQETRTEGILHLTAGTAYLTAIKQLLTLAGIALAIETPSAAVLAEDREDWEPGSSYLDIINTLLGEINYAQLWFNERGYAILQPRTLPSVLNIRHRLDGNDVRSLLFTQIRRKTDVFRAPNVFICVCSNPDKSGPMTATAVNDNPQSPLSIQRRGRRIMKQYKLNNIASQEELQAYADRLRNESMQIGETISISTGLRAGHGIGDTVALNLGEVQAICRETAWEMELKSGGRMSHSLERTVYNL